MLLQFKIQIKGIKKPPVWRRVLVPAQFTFERFHRVIQRAFGWDDYHLFSFLPKGYDPYPIIGIPDEWSEEDMDATKTKLSAIFKKAGQTFLYIYDFGDNWEHEITLEAITKDNALFASCPAGKGECPPEDCGGVWGYESLKETLKNPDDEEHQSMLDWLSLNSPDEWDPTYFDLEETNEWVKSV